MISRSASYAIRSAAFLASEAARPWELREHIAEQTRVPASFLGKVLQALVAEGLVESRRGRQGGFRLARDPESLPLLDLVNPFDHLGEDRRCLLDRPECSACGPDASPCALHARWRPVRDALIAILRETTLADVVAHGDTSPGLPQVAG